MRLASWIDHVPPWLAYGAVVSTGVYEPGELALMAVPLLFAALAEGRRWDFAAWRRTFELLALVCLAALAWARLGLIPTVILMLFLLCGMRLTLPRNLSQRRQLLLMGFLIWITTAIATFELSFLLWSLLWVAGAALVLLQQAWEGSAALRGGPLQRTPYRRLPGWTLGTVLLSAVFFVVLPRLSSGLRAFPWGVAGLTASRAGFSDALDLGPTGPIAPSGEAVLRILPPSGKPSDHAESLALLKAISLEVLYGQRWGAQRGTPPTEATRRGTFIARPIPFEYFVAPSPSGILPLPYGRLQLLPPRGLPILDGPGGSLRWGYPSRRALPLRFLLEPSATLAEAAPSAQRWQLLTEVGQGTASADRFSRRLLPEGKSPQEVARRLSASLRSFTYTLDNPSGNAPNPLQDFLERTHAGHCEYFASALALMLRYRGIPARVANGYRLGPWIGEGGYWLVTENEAHSWVEFYDLEAKVWRVEDPTPAAPPRGLGAATFWAAFQRGTDALRFRWDRYVVRFSDEDQMAGLDWMQVRFSRLPSWRPGRGTLLAGLLVALGGLAAWGTWRLRPRWRRQHPPGSARGLKPLKPLLHAVGRTCPPESGETLHQWFLRLARLAPERADTLARVAEEADAVAYGEADAQRLKSLVKTEAKAWRHPARST